MDGETHHPDVDKLPDVVQTITGREVEVSEHVRKELGRLEEEGQITVYHETGAPPAYWTMFDRLAFPPDPGWAGARVSVADWILQFTNQDL
jgi:hypothetical protein